RGDVRGARQPPPPAGQALVSGLVAGLDPVVGDLVGDEQGGERRGERGRAGGRGELIEHHGGLRSVDSGGAGTRREACAGGTGPPAGAWSVVEVGPVSGSRSAPRWCRPRRRPAHRPCRAPSTGPSTATPARG